MPTADTVKDDYQYQTDEIDVCHDWILNKIASAHLQGGPKRILDLGCGSGKLTNALREMGHEVIGIDNSRSGIDAAKRHFPETEFRCENVYEISSAEELGEFDLVIAIEVIEHLYYPRKLIQSARRFVRPGGTVVVSTPYYGYLKNLLIALTGRMDRHFTALWDGGHIKLFSVKTLTELLKTEGAKDIHFMFGGREIPFLWQGMIASCRFS